MGDTKKKIIIKMKVFINLKKMMMPASNKKRKKVIDARKAKWRLIYFLHSPFFLSGFNIALCETATRATITMSEETNPCPEVCRLMRWPKSAIKCK